MRRTQSLHSINYDSTNSSVYQSRDSVDVLQKSIYDSLCPCKIMARQIFGQLVSCMFEMSLKKLCLHVLSSGSHLSNTKHPACSACLRILVPSTTCLKRSETHFGIYECWDNLLETQTESHGESDIFWRKFRKKFSRFNVIAFFNRSRPRSMQHSHVFWE